MATLSEHVAAVQAAIQAAREDGYLLGWDFDHDYSVDYPLVEEVSLSLYRNRRGEDGIMRQVERELVLEAYV